MDERDFITIASVLANEIEVLRFQNQQLEEANRNLIDQIERLHVEIHISKGESK